MTSMLLVPLGGSVNENNSAPEERAKPTDTREDDDLGKPYRDMGLEPLAPTDMARGD